MDIHKNSFLFLDLYQIDYNLVVYNFLPRREDQTGISQLKQQRAL